MKTNFSLKPGGVLPGLDALQQSLVPETANVLKGRKIGLLTNHTGSAQSGASTLIVLQELGFSVHSLFSPEHGFDGNREGHIESSTYKQLPIHSLYGDTRRPTREMLNGIEVLVCDLQDVGARFYTYSTTLAYCLEECARLGIAVVVLDRPNPIGGVLCEGPRVDETNKSFVGYLDIPIRHGLTIGELALLHKSDKALDAELHIAGVLNWRREMLWPDTNLKWPVPSPNLPDWISAAWYPGICLLEFSGVSVGRGTDAPFQIIGAPWMSAAGVLSAMDKWPDEVRENFSAEAIEFTPTRGECEGVLCNGLKFGSRQSGHPLGRIENRQSFVPLGLCLLSTLRALHDEFNFEKSLQLLGSSEVLELLRAGALQTAIEICERDAKDFKKRREEISVY